MQGRSVATGRASGGFRPTGRGTRVMAHATIMGWTEIGEGNEIHSGVVLGDAPQDFAYKGGESYLVIGHYNIFRESVQVHRGTAPGSSTVMGNNNFIKVPLINSFNRFSCIFSIQIKHKT